MIGNKYKLDNEKERILIGNDNYIVITDCSEDAADTEQGWKA